MSQKYLIPLCGGVIACSLIAYSLLSINAESVGVHFCLDVLSETIAGLLVLLIKLLS